MSAKRISLSAYLLSRIKSLGIHEIFGVPGDYNLAFLDHVVAHEGLLWVGNCNELNAAYAADGYARINGMGALVTTFGVGELSAINGIAGSFAEYLPIIHIVGWPATTIQEKGMIMHHTLGTGHFDMFLDMFKKVSAAVTVIDSSSDATKAIDNILEISWRTKRPVYIGLPSNLVDMLVEAPTKPLNLKYPTSNPDVVNELVFSAEKIIRRAKKPVIIIDVCALRHPMKPFLEILLKKTGIPFATMNMAKGIFEESHPNFLGGYSGDYSTAGVQKRVENSDCILIFGSILSDYNTGGFSCHLNVHHTIEIHSDHVKIRHALYNEVYFDAVMTKLINVLDNYQYQEAIAPLQLPSLKIDFETITQKQFWYKMAHYFKPNDIIVAEVGTSLFGILETPILAHATIITQPLWASIGYSVGALLGACLANKKRRAILFVGDGSFQLTAQEISTMLKHHLTPIIFLLNNQGYTIERVIHGLHMSYNDVQPWQYATLPKVFGQSVHASVVNNEIELDKALTACENHRDKLCFIEVKLDKEDCPQTLKKLGQIFDAKNEK